MALRIVHYSWHLISRCIMRSERSKRAAWHFSQGCFYSLTQAVVSALIVLEVAHSQRIWGDLLTALRERLDDVQPRPSTKLLVLRAHANTHTRDECKFFHHICPQYVHRRSSLPCDQRSPSQSTGRRADLPAAPDHLWKTLSRMQTLWEKKRQPTSEESEYLLPNYLYRPAPGNYSD